MRKNLLAVQIVLWLSFSGTSAQILSFQQYSLNEGLPNARIYSLIQDDRGFLWMGTGGGGVVRFDGIHAKILNHSDGLPDDFVRVLFETGNGEIWIGTDGGLCIYDGFSVGPFPVRSVLDSTLILSINQDPAGNILVGTRYEGFFKIDFSEDTTIRQFSQPDGLISEGVFDVEVIGDSTYWLSMIGGIDLVENGGSASGKATPVGRVFLPRTVFTCSDKGPEGTPWQETIWSGSRDFGLFILKPGKQGTFVMDSLPAALDFLRHETIWDLQWTDSVTCWIATESSGLVRYKEDEAILITRENGLPTNQIYRILSGREGEIWLGTLGNGVWRYTGEQFVQYDLNPSRQGMEVFGFGEESPGRMLAATDDGLYRVDLSDPYSPQVTKIVSAEAISDQAIKAIAVSRQGDAWLGTSHGLYRYSGGVMEYAEYNRELSSTRINALLLDREERIWVGTDDGYSVISKEGVLSMNEESGLIHNEVQTMISDRNGHVWIGTLGGLVRISDLYHYRDFNEEEGLTTLQIHDLVEDAQGNIWIGTFGGGLYRLNTGADEPDIEAVRGNDRLSSKNIYSLLFENDSTLIAATESGFDRISLASDSIRRVIHYGVSDGFPQGTNILNALYRSSDRRIWFGTSGGLVVYDPSEEMEFLHRPEVYIEDIRLFYDPVNWRTGHEVSSGFNLPVHLTLSHQQNHLTFDYTAIFFRNPEDIQFTCFLEGYNNFWSPPTNERSVTYEGLPPGEYEFRLKAVSKYGLESDASVYSFRIRPPFWLNPWFLAPASLLLIFLILLAVRLRVRKLRQDKAHLERIVELRTWEIRQQKEQIEEQHGLVVSQQKEITDSIRYAKQIQQAILPEEKLLNQVFKDCFVMLEPQHIVSGDFYWVGRSGDHLVVAAADCTGHGVPGAFMSMLGISFLNKIVNEESMVMPAEILNALRENVLDVFHHRSEQEEGSRDGMDIALCSYHLPTGELYYAGAMNPLYLIRKVNGEAELIEYKPDKMPVGKHSRIVPFTQKKIDIREGDALYLFSDGFSDQFGGDRGKKFMKRRFKRMLLDHHHLPMCEQQSKYEGILHSWINYQSPAKISPGQTDDILIIGVKIS